MPFRILSLAAAVVAAAAALGRTNAAPASAKHEVRIVSLVPSLTEDLFALGAGANVVGVSVYTDYPPAAKRVPVVATYAAVQTERIVALHPDMVIGIPAQARLTADLVRLGVPVRLLPDDAYRDIFTTLRAIGALTGREREAGALIAHLRARTAALVASVPARARKPSAFVVLGTGPIFTVGDGSYIAQLIALAGGRNAAADVRPSYARYSAESLLAHQPDALIVDPAVHLNAVLAQPPWNGLRAVREGRVYTLPDPAILERPGPRYNDGLAWLIAALRNVR